MSFSFGPQIDHLNERIQLKINVMLNRVNRNTSVKIVLNIFLE